MSAFSPRQMFLLDEACKPIVKAFGDTPYLVGTAVTRTSYRDVDVRLILDDDKYARLVDVAGTDLIAFLGLAIGEYLAARTGMPIDFQVQQQTAANDLHTGSRNPLGLRKLGNYRGDAAPAPIDELVEHSSFGEVDAAAARGSVSDGKALDLVSRSKLVSQDHVDGSTK